MLLYQRNACILLCVDIRSNSTTLRRVALARMFKEAWLRSPRTQQTKVQIDITVRGRRTEAKIIYDKSKQILASLATPIYLLLYNLSNYLTLKQIDINNSIRGCQSRYLSPTGWAFSNKREKFSHLG